MRVLHVIPSLDERDGGPSVALPLMARSLAMHGITVDVAATMNSEDARVQKISFGDPLQRDGHTVRFFKRQTSLYKFSLPLWRWLGEHARDYALVHNHAVFSFAPLAGARAARLAKIPYLIRPLGLLNAWGMEQRRPWIKALSLRLLDRPALNDAAAIHYTSDEEQREAARLRLRAKPLVIPLGIDISQFQIARDTVPFFNRYPAARDRRIILFLSRLDPKKGLETLLEAFAATKQIESGALLVIAGSGTEDYEARLREYARSLGLSDRVLWTGFLTGADKISALQTADIFVLPSYSENFGIALVEAMASGCACITTHAVGIAGEVQRGNAAILTTAGDAASLAAAITQLLANQQMRSDLGAAAAQLAAGRFSLFSTGAALAKAYEEIAKACVLPAQ